MIRLFIENQEVELNNEVTFAITKQFEDITNPTTIINDWSKTVEIPFTACNNKLFGHIYNPDKVIVDSVLNTGIFFNPLKKMNFRLEYNNAVLMQGYGKMNSITQSNGKGSYNITLFGELGKVFSEMKKITFDESTDTPEYLISGETYFSEYITKELVYDSWTSLGQSATGLTGDFTNYIGFAPNNSFDEDFDYTTWQNGDSSSSTFEETLNGVSFSDATGIEPKTAIPNGLYPREIGEYRSYLQLPYIYFNKLFRIFQAKAESITGYQFVLDSNWFNTSNPYWYDLVYMLKKLDVSNGDSYNNYYNNIKLDTGNSSQYYFQRWDLSGFNTPSTGRIFTNNVISEQVPILIHTSSPKVNRFTINEPTTLNYKLNTYFIMPTTGDKLKTNNGLLLTIYVTGANSNTEEQKFLIINENSTLTYSGATIVKTGTAPSGSSTLEVPTMDAYFLLTSNKFGSYVETSYEIQWLYNTYPYNDSQIQGTSYFYTRSSGNASTVSAKISGNHWARSQAKLTLNRLWNNDYNLFDEILNYCKIYRIGIFVDENHKVIIFKPLDRYFKDFNIVDWTDKIDKSKDFSIKPITFEDKYVMFNYEDDSTKLSKQYSENYGVKYGEYRLITEYNFNDETQNLFEGVKTSMNNTDNVLSWTNLYDNKAIIYTFPSETYVYNKNDEGKNVDCFGRYYFFRGLANFDNDIQLRSVILSDDTAFQQFNDKYFYSQAYSAKGVTTYPYLSVLKGNNICLFNLPMQNYTYNITEYNGKDSIYYNIWEKYINERYNSNNKLVTCHVRLKLVDYMKFAFNKFVRIENQVYMVNKIYDYDITSEEATKVDLITIQDITGYTTNNL